MVSRFSNFKRRIMSALLLLCALGMGEAWAQNDGRPAVAGGLTGTNYFTRGGGSDKPLPGQGRMDQFEDELFGTQRRLSLDNPGENPAPAPKAARLAPLLEEQAKEKMDENKNWAFSTMNELNSPPSPEELMGLPEIGPDGQPRPKLSAMERYYQNLDKTPQFGSNELMDVMTVMWNLKQLSGSNGLNPMIFAFPGGEETVMKNMMLPPQMGSGGWDKSAASDAAPATDAATAAASTAEQEQNRRLNNFKQLLGEGSAPPAGLTSSFGSINNYLNPPPAATSSYGSEFSTGYAPTPSPAVAPYNPSALSPVMGGFTPAAGGYQPSASGFNNNPVIGPGGLENNRNVLTQTPESALPPSLDPFRANFPKHQF
jgi:hypothetical protein